MCAESQNYNSVETLTAHWEIFQSNETLVIRLCCQSTERSRVVSIATHGLCLSDVTADCVSTLESVCEIQVFQHGRLPVVLLQH